jgi:hypothetical protein
LSILFQIFFVILQRILKNTVLIVAVKENFSADRTNKQTHINKQKPTGRWDITADKYHEKNESSFRSKAAHAPNHGGAMLHNDVYCSAESNGGL